MVDKDDGKEKSRVSFFSILSKWRGWFYGIISIVGTSVIVATFGSRLRVFVCNNRIRYGCNSNFVLTAQIATKRLRKRFAMR